MQRVCHPPPPNNHSYGKVDKEPDQQASRLLLWLSNQQTHFRKASYGLGLTASRQWYYRRTRRHEVKHYRKTLEVDMRRPRKSKKFHTFIPAFERGLFRLLEKRVDKNVGCLEIISKKQSHLLSKDAFPPLLILLSDDVCPFHESIKNLKTEFKKCELYPLNVQPNVPRLPGGIIGPQTSEKSSL